MKRPLMILFAKAPLAGKVKTRLVPSLSAQNAAELHRRMVSEAWSLAAGFRPYAAVELHTDLPTSAWPEIHPRRLQSSGDLGTRMLGALTAGLAAGFMPCLILGSDAPGLPRTHLAQLLEQTADVALGPTEDGGYYAISCRRVAPRMFEGVRWSAAGTLEDTVRASQSCGLRVETGPPWFDIDVPADLERLRAVSNILEGLL